MNVCQRCHGNGQYMGQGFMMTDCEYCTGGYHREKSNAIPTLDKINRKSKSYQNAIKDIMAINKDISREDAIKMFDEAYIKS